LNFSSKSSTSHSSPSSSKLSNLSHLSDVFLSMKKKYKPVVQKVQPIIGKLLEKFRIH
jgi:hypothetical protein